MESQEKAPQRESLKTLPSDDVRQILWRFQERYDLQMLVQSSRSVARGLVARLVAEGARNSHDWTPQKNQLLPAFDESGITTCFMEPHQGGFIEGPKNLALALVAWELSWVDGGAATCSLAGNLALSPIHERGTEAQRDFYMSRCVPAKAAEAGHPVWRGAFALTEPLPYVGVETGLLSGKASLLSWEDGKEPLLQIEKRGRFITGMGFANFVTAAVDTADPRLKSSCIVILEEGDPGVYDRGTPTKKLVHQLSSTNDPVFSLQVPASRIVGGYTVKDGVLIPNYSHGEVIEAVFRRTRVTVGVMTAAKLVSAVEPVIRYHRNRFRGGSSVTPGTPRYEMGLQQKEDAVQRLVEVAAMGEASASLGFAAARLFDELDPVERRKDARMAELGITSGVAQMKHFRRIQKEAIEYIELASKPEGEREAARFEALRADVAVQYLVLDAQANVLCPATKLWCTGQGATVMREAVSLVGGYGITEDCPGFLGTKWMDAQLEATYEGPEAVQRRQLSVTMVSEVFLAALRSWVRELRALGLSHPHLGAATIAKALELWLWSLEHLQKGNDAFGTKLFSGNRQGVSFQLADALCWLLASRHQMLDLLELEAKGPSNPVVAEGLSGTLGYLSDLAKIQSARAAGEVCRICAELVHGYQSPSAPSTLETYSALRTQVEATLAGARLAKDRAAEALLGVMIPEAQDYPV